MLEKSEHETMHSLMMKALIELKRFTNLVCQSIEMPLEFVMKKEGRSYHGEKIHSFLYTTKVFATNHGSFLETLVSINYRVSLWIL